MAILTATTDVNQHPNFKAESQITRPFSCFGKLRLESGVFVSTEMSEWSFVSADTEKETLPNQLLADGYTERLTL